MHGVKLAPVLLTYCIHMEGGVPGGAMLFGEVQRFLVLILIVVFASESVFSKNLSNSKLDRKKRKSDYSKSGSYAFDVSIDTNVGLEEDKEISNDLNFSAFYKHNADNRFVFEMSFTKTYPETIGPNESEFFVNAPAVNYIHNPNFMYDRFYWDTILLGVEGTSSEAYKDISRLFTLSAGTKWGIRVLSNLKFEHKIIFNKYFDRYVNGPSGTNVSHDLINAFDLKLSLIDKLMLGSGISFIHNKTYGRALYLTRVFSLYGEYTLPYDWSVGAKFTSSDDYSMYSREKLELYNRNNSMFIFTIGKSF